MNTTELLCRVFDRRKKGYVEWGDVFDALPYAIAGIVAVGAYVRGGYYVVTAWDIVVGYKITTATWGEISQTSCVALFLVVSGIMAIIAPLAFISRIYYKYRYKRIVTCEKEK